MSGLALICAEYTIYAHVYTTFNLGTVKRTKQRSFTRHSTEWLFHTLYLSQDLDFAVLMCKAKPLVTCSHFSVHKPRKAEWPGEQPFSDQNIWERGQQTCHLCVPYVLMLLYFAKKTTVWSMMIQDLFPAISIPHLLGSFLSWFQGAHVHVHVIFWKLFRSNKKSNNPKNREKCRLEKLGLNHTAPNPSWRHMACSNAQEDKPAVTLRGLKCFLWTSCSNT